MIGIIVVLFSGAAISFFMVRELEKRMTNTRALCRLLRICTEQVEYFARSSGDIISGCELSLLRECGYYGTVPVQTFFEFLNSCEILCSKSRAIMLEFAADFGKNYREEQIKRCKYYSERMALRLSELETSLPTQRKLVVALSLSATLMAVILLV